MKFEQTTIHGATLTLHPAKAIWWEATNTLLIADTHFGKVSHFRKAGIAIPNDAMLQDFAKLQYLLDEFEVERVLFLGDLFHSEHNKEWDLLGQVLKKYPAVSFELIVGNHDILTPENYQQNGLKVHWEQLEEPPFLFTHEPIEQWEGPLYNLCGHIHPGVKLRGAARQGIRLPCFYFSAHQGILPAFCELAGCYILKPKRQDDVFIVVEEEVVKV